MGAASKIAGHGTRPDRAVSSRSSRSRWPRTPPASGVCARSPLHGRWIVRSAPAVELQGHLKATLFPISRPKHHSRAGENCVEVAELPCGAAIRGSKHPAAGHLPPFPATEWTCFLSNALTLWPSGLRLAPKSSEEPDRAHPRHSRALRSSVTWFGQYRDLHSAHPGCLAYKGCPAGPS